MTGDAPCDDCSAAITADLGGEHRRCTLRSCPCSCRAPQLDMAKADSRLRVAVACRAALGSDLRLAFEMDDSQAAAYVEGILLDRLQEEMDRLMGVTVDAEAESVPSTPVLSEADVAAVRELTAILPALRAAMSAVPRYAPTLPAVQHSSEGFDPEEQQQLPAPPRPPEQKTKPKNINALRRGGQPMPSPAAMQHVTMAQSSFASQMGANAFEQVRLGQAKSSGGSPESSG